VNDEEIYRKHREDLVRYAAVLVGPADADDLVSAVVLRTLARRRLSDLDNARPYLFRAVLNESRSLLSRRRDAPSVVDVGVTDSDPRFEVLGAVLRLPTQQRAATYLVYWADLSISEVSMLMGIRPGTVKRYLFLARRSLKGALHER
jgi:RNA polymerase sigma factor (sigma-70 family)